MQNEFSAYTLANLANLAKQRCEQPEEPRSAPADAHTIPHWRYRIRLADGRTYHVHYSPREPLAVAEQEARQRWGNALAGTEPDDPEPDRGADFYRVLFAKASTPVALVTLNRKQTRQAIEAGLLTVEEANGMVVLGYRNATAQCLLTLPRERYDGLALLELLERQALGSPVTEIPRRRGRPPNPGTLSAAERQRQRRVRRQAAAAEAGVP
jgi:hypothetical protein